MRVVIVEDEAAASRRLKKLLHEINPAIEVLQELDSIETSLEWLGMGHEYDLLLLDIHLADGSSFEIFEHIEIEKPIIFTTAYDEYAIKAFKVNAIDYLLKPIKKAELSKAIERFESLRKNSDSSLKNLLKSLKPENSSNYQKRFLIRIGQNIKVVEVNDAAYFYTEDKITFLITQAGKRYPVDYSLEKLDSTLNPQKFFRINRQFIINIDAIQDMYAYSKSRVKIGLNPPSDFDTIVSTERSPRFKKWLVGE